MTQQNETLEAENLVLKGEIQKLRQIIYDQQADEKWVVLVEVKKYKIWNVFHQKLNLRKRQRIQISRIDCIFDA